MLLSLLLHIPDKRIIVTIHSLAEDKVPAIDKLFNIHKEIPNLYYELKILQDLIIQQSISREQIKEDRHVMFGAAGNLLGYGYDFAVLIWFLIS